MSDHAMQATKETHSPRPTLRTALLLALALAMSGCASGPDHRAPSTPDAAAGPFVTRLAEANGDAQMPSQWWKLYDDPTLDGAVKEALAANTELRQAMANLERARAIRAEARGGLYPSTLLSAGAGYGRDQTAWTGTAQAPKQWNYSAGLDVSYELDLFARVRRDVEASQDDTEAVAAAFDAARVVVVAQVTRAYVDACAYGESMAVARSSVDLAQRSLTLVGTQARAGSASRLDVERSALALAQAQAALPPLQGQRDAVLFELAALMGRTPSEVPSMAKACVKQPSVAMALPVGDGAALLRRRPDIRQAERRLAADTARIGVAVAELYPRVSLGASGSYLRNEQLKGDRAWSFSLGPLVSWSFPNVMVARSRIAQAKAQGAASLASFDGAVLNALKETEQSLSAYGAALGQRDALGEARARAENAFGLAERRYRAGAIAYLDVIVAQAGLVDARSQLAAADQRVGAARVGVFKALGGGWESPGGAPGPEPRDGQL